MKSPVIILNTDSTLKASNLTDRLVWAGITFHFALVGVQYTVTVEESDVAQALGGIR